MGNLQEAIANTKQISVQSKVEWFHQEALEHVAAQCYYNSSFAVESEGGLDIVDEFYTDEPKPEQYQQKHVLDIQKGLQQSVRVVN